MVGVIKKLLAAGIILLLVGVSIPSTGRVMDTVNPVSSDGIILYVGGSGPGNYTRIQDAINDAHDGDTVFVFDDSSPYYENVVVDNSINLIGEDNNTTIIDGSGVGDVVHIANNVDRVTISGFTIRHSGTSCSDAMIEVETDYNIICGSIITNDNFPTGIYCPSDNNTIFDNIITDNHLFGILIGDSYDNNIYRNIITNNDYAGILITPENIPSKLSYQGVGWNNSIYGNTISNNGWAGVWWNGGITLVGTFGNNISENNITNNKKGILIDAPWYCSCRNNLVYRNNIMNNRVGIAINIIITLPDFEKVSSAVDNKIYQNNFIGNRYDARDYDDNIWDSNYWDGWIGLRFKFLKFLPYLISGWFPFSLIRKLFPFNWDWNSASEPYDI